MPKDISAAPYATFSSIFSSGPQVLVDRCSSLVPSTGLVVSYITSSSSLYHYDIKIIVVCPCIHLSVMEGQQKQFDLKTQDAVTVAVERKKLEIGIFCEYLCKALATDTNTTFLDRQYKKQVLLIS